MSIANLKCECCLGDLKLISSKRYKCVSCGKEYIDQVLSEEETIWLASANKDLRMGNFDEAYNEFSNIISKYPKNHEAYFGMTLCTHGIIYVDDLLEGKKVPTCYNVAITSFLDDDNYKKALTYAPKEIKDNYIEQANKIEIIRKEWLEKASKEEPYDVFISFKQSDRENDIEKTKDYYACLEIYNYLQYKCGLNVFFSPETLKNKISERYEPYIYNALNTSKVMILYGQKPEYLTSTWVKNEWIRYLKKIINHEKEQNSLIVAYENFDAYRLPKELKNLQALDASSKDFLITLTNHINGILNRTQNKEKLERKEIKVGQIAPRSRSIGDNQIVKRELGSGAITTKDASITKLLKSIEVCLKKGKFSVAEEILNEILSSEPENSNALLYSLMIECRLKDIKDLSKLIIDDKARLNMNEIDNLISKLDKDNAISLINILKDALITKINKKYKVSKGFVQSNFEDDLLDMFNVLSRYNYIDSNKINKMILDASAVNDAYLKLFNQALRTLENTDIDKYIDYHISFIKNIENDNLIDKNYILQETGQELDNIKKIKTYILERALKVDEGNEKVLFELFKINYDIKYFEQSLQFAKDEKNANLLINRYLDYFLKDIKCPYYDLIQYIDSKDNKQYIKYVEKRYTIIKKYIEDESNEDRKKYVSQAKKFLTIIIKEKGETQNIMFELYKYNLGCATENDLIYFPISLDKVPSFTKEFSLLAEKYQNKILSIIEKQKQVKPIVTNNNKEEVTNLKQVHNKNNEKSTPRTKVINLSLFTFIINIGLVLLGFIKTRGENINLYFDFEDGGTPHNYIIFITVGVLILCSILNLILHLIRKNRLVLSVIFNILNIIAYIFVCLHFCSVYIDRLVSIQFQLVLILLFCLVCIILSIINIVMSVKKDDDVFEIESYENSLRGGIILKYIAYFFIILLSLGTVIGGGFIPFFSGGTLYDNYIGILSIGIYCTATITYLIRANNEKYDDIGKGYIVFIVVSIILGGFLDHSVYCRTESCLYMVVYIVGGFFAFWATKIKENINHDIKYLKEKK